MKQIKELKCRDHYISLIKHLSIHQGLNSMLWNALGTEGACNIPDIIKEHLGVW